MKRSIHFAAIYFSLLFFSCLPTSHSLGQLQPQTQVQTQNASVLPTDPAQWINSVPITQEMLKGKAAFLWFYEET